MAYDSSSIENTRSFMYDVLQFDACGEIVFDRNFEVGTLYFVDPDCIAISPFPEGISSISDGLHESINAMSVQYIGRST